MSEWEKQALRMAKNLERSNELIFGNETPSSDQELELAWALQAAEEWHDDVCQCGVFFDHLADKIGHVQVAVKYQ